MLVLGIFPVMAASNDGIRRDPLRLDDNLEVEHLYKGQWPVGIAVSASGRKFSSFPAFFDELNTYNGSNNVYQVAELTGFDTETAYPNISYNSPPGGAVDTTRTIPVTKGLENYLLSVLSVYIDLDDVLWIVDCGRVLYEGMQLDPSFGGPKLVAVDLTTNDVIRTYLFDSSIATRVSAFGDVRVDTVSRFAYLSDLSPTRNNAIVVLDLTSGEAWRRLERDFSVLAFEGFLPFVYGEPRYQVQFSPSGEPVGIGSISVGVDGLALSPDAGTLYFSDTGGRYLFSIATHLLRDRNTTRSELVAGVQNLGAKGFSAGLVSDRSGNIYAGQAENNGVSVYNTTTDFVVLFVRDKRINFVSRLSVAEEILYFIVNQYVFIPLNYRGQGPLGQDVRETPYVLLKTPLP